MENAAPDRALAWSLEEVAVLTPPDSAMGAVLWGVAADPAADRIYVMDGSASRVVAFDGSGDVVGAYGGRGEGPGEFLNPTAVSVEGGEGVTVWDAGRAVLSRWSIAGDLLDERRAPLSYWGPGFREIGDDLLVVTAESSGLEMQQTLVRWSAGDTVVLHVVPREMTMVDWPCARRPAPRLFAADVVWAPNGDTAYRVGRAGIPDRPVRGRRPGGEYPASDRADRGDGGDGDRASAIRAVRLVRAHVRRHGGAARRCGRYEERAAAVQWLAVDPDGRVWVARTRDGLVAEAVDIIDADGSYVGTLASPGMPVAFPSASRVVMLSIRPQTGETVLTLYDIREMRG